MPCSTMLFYIVSTLFQSQLSQHCSSHQSQRCSIFSRINPALSQLQSQHCSSQQSETCSSLQCQPCSSLNPALVLVSTRPALVSTPLQSLVFCSLIIQNLQITIKTDLVKSDYFLLYKEIFIQGFSLNHLTRIISQLKSNISGCHKQFYYVY